MSAPDDSSDPKQRKEILTSLFNIPYLQGVAKRIYKQIASQAEPKKKEEPRKRVVVQMTDARSLDASLDQLSPFPGADVFDISPGDAEREAVPSEVSTVVSTLSDKMANVSTEEFEDFVGQLQSSIQLTSNLQVPGMQESPMGSVSRDTQEFAADTQEFAAYLGISAEDLEDAMAHENIPSLDALYQLFTADVDSFAAMPQMANFDVFVKCFVQSYLDEKNEEKLLGLIGVSAKTGKQKLNTPYAKLLSEIFMPGIGGFFLKNTENQNYNCFNVGNVIQEQLLELEEVERVAYLEKLLHILKGRESLLPKTRQVLSASMVKKYYIDTLPNRDVLLPKLEQYLADLAIFRLGFVNHERLPADIRSLILRDVYDSLAFVVGFPPHIVERSAKFVFMFQKLCDDEPLLFYTRR